MSNKTSSALPLSDDPEANYESFIEAIMRTGKIWGLKADDGWAVCPSIEFEDTEVFPFWSDAAYAKIHCVDEWKHYKADFISMEDFIADWLPGMHEDNAMVGPNWDSEMSGLEIEPADLAAQLVEP